MKQVADTASLRAGLSRRPTTTTLRRCGRSDYSWRSTWFSLAARQGHGGRPGWAVPGQSPSWTASVSPTARMLAATVAATTAAIVPARLATRGAAVVPRNILAQASVEAAAADERPLVDTLLPSEGGAPACRPRC